MLLLLQSLLHILKSWLSLLYLSVFYAAATFKGGRYIAAAFLFEHFYRFVFMGYILYYSR